MRDFNEEHRFHVNGCDRYTSTPSTCACGFIQWHVANPLPSTRETLVNERWKRYDALRLPPKPLGPLMDNAVMEAFLKGLSTRAQALEVTQE